MAVTTERELGAARRWAVGEPGLLFGVLVGALAMLRVAGGLTSVWADDAVMVAAARWHGPWSTISFPYQGYLNVAPMLSAQIVEPLPVAAVPLALVIIWAAVAGALAVLVARVSRSFLERGTSRLFLGAAVSLTPIAAFESLGSIANLQWLLVVASIIVLVGEPTGRAEQIASGVVLALAAASAPAALALAPLVVWRHRRHVHVIAYSIGALAQVATILSEWGARDSGGDWLAVWDIPTSFLWAGLNGLTSSTWQPYSPRFLSIALIVVGAAGVWLSRQRRWQPTVAVIAAGLAVWWFTYGAAGDTPARPRYTIIPAVCLLAGLLWSTERRPRLHLPVIGVLLVGVAFGFSASILRTSGPSWSQQLDANECVDGEILLGVSPAGRGAVVLPCD